jgi:hypothetical protein
MTRRWPPPIRTVARAIVTRRAETRRQYRGAPFAQARSYRAYANRARWPRSGHAPETFSGYPSSRSFRRLRHLSISPPTTTVLATATIINSTSAGSGMVRKTDCRNGT